MQPSSLENLKALSAKATKGPWLVVSNAAGYPDKIQAPGDNGVPGACGHIVRNGGIGMPGSRFGQSNAALICAVRNRIDALIAVAEAAQREAEMHRIFRNPKPCLCPLCAAIRAMGEQ